MAGRKILFSAQKNEGLFLEEWIAYHKVIGFTDIVIFSNDCTDGSELMLDQLDDARVIRHFHHSPAPGVAPQKNAARIAQEAGLFRKGDWVMWLDIDEFLVPNVGDGTVGGLLRAAPDCDALMVGWRHFGDSGRTTWPGRQICDQFTMARAARDDLTPQVKTLFRWSDDIALLDIHRPFLKRDVPVEDFVAITSTGDPAKWRRRTKRNIRVPFKSIRTPGDWWKLAQVNHYCVRTPDLFQQKVQRGRGYAPGDEDQAEYYRSYYKRLNFNEARDRRILRYEAATTAMMADLGQYTPGPRQLAA
ncbi:MAG: glycosyltransferase family 2 protein [Pseudomonadota bacterium]